MKKSVKARRGCQARSRHHTARVAWQAPVQVTLACPVPVDAAETPAPPMKRVFLTSPSGAVRYLVLGRLLIGWIRQRGGYWPFNVTKRRGIIGVRWWRLDVAWCSA